VYLIVLFAEISTDIEKLQVMGPDYSESHHAALRKLDIRSRWPLLATWPHHNNPANTEEVTRPVGVNAQGENQLIS